MVRAVSVSRVPCALRTSSTSLIYIFILHSVLVSADKGLLMPGRYTKRQLVNFAASNNHLPR
jgi:hypothetical protein